MMRFTFVKIYTNTVEQAVEARAANRTLTVTFLIQSRNVTVVLEEPVMS